MNTSHRNLGKVSEHFCGTGIPNDERVEARARELALTNGRPPNQYTQEDWLQARREVLGLDDTDTDEEQSIAANTRYTEVAGTRSRAAEKVDPNDEQTQAERLVRQGVNEAAHEQMISGAREDHNQA